LDTGILVALFDLNLKYFSSQEQNNLLVQTSHQTHYKGVINTYIILV